MTRDPSEILDALAQEFVERARRGEAPSIEAYAEAHADLAAEIRDLFPVLAVVEGLKDGPSHAAGAPPGRPTHALPLPDRVGPYRVVREIGRGGMGSVHEARRDDDASRVALKVIHPHLLESAEFVARFLQEAEAGARVAHPGVVETLGTGLVDVGGDEVPYLVLEYVEGQDLRALLEEVEVVPERLCRLVASRVAEALAAVHAAGLVHRDVKPENVVITPDETVKLMDLGVAVLQAGAYRLSRTGEFVGSVLYAAPEQIVGADPHPRWDLYSLGVTLYELATGRHPARDARARWLAPGSTARSTPPATDLKPELSPFFGALIQRLLAPDPAERPESAAALVTILEEGERSAWWREQRRREPRAAYGGPGGLDRAVAFHGRAEEWRTLDRLRDETLEGCGRVLLLEGDAGMGKTRLLHEWIASARDTSTRPTALVATHDPGAIEGGEGGLAVALLEHLGTANLETRLEGLLGRRAPLAAPLAKHLRGEGTTARGRVIDGVALDAAYGHLLRGLAAEAPLVVAVEDLHFASEESRRRFLYLARSLENFPVFLIGTVRTVPAPTWATEVDGLPHARHVVLDGLEPEACRELVVEAAAACTHVDESIASLAERCDRNPYFLLELVRECAQRPPDTDAPSPAEMQIPDSVRGVLGTRLAALDTQDHELLEAAACCGHEFDPLLVAEAAGLGRIAALKHFGRLEREHGLLRPVRRDYRFQHHLLQEVLYAEMHPALKESYHAALGRALEARTSVEGRVSGARATALCTHCFEGNEPARARPYLRRALQYLDWERHAITRAAALARRALETDDGLAGADRAFALVVHANALNLHAHLPEALAAAEEAQGLALQGEEGVLPIDVLMLLGAIHTGREDAEAMREAYLSAARRARAIGDPGREANALGDLGLQLQDLGRTEEAEDCFRRGFEVLEGHESPFREGRLTMNLARIEIHRRNLDEGERLLRRAQELADSAGDLTTEAQGLLTLGQLAVRKGHFRESVDWGVRSLDLGRHLGLGNWNVTTLANIAYAQTELGRHDEALRLLDEAVAMAERGNDKLHPAHSKMRRGVLYLHRGDLAAALDDLETSTLLGREVKRPDIVAATACALAQGLGLVGRQSEALVHLDAAAEAVGPKRLGRVRVVRAELAEFRGEDAEAHEIYAAVRAGDAPGSLPAARMALPLARTKIRLGDLELARPLLEEALAWGRESGVVRLAVLAQVYLAALEEGDRLAARVALEKHAAALPAAEHIEAYWVLGDVTGESEHLEAARRRLDLLCANARPEDRAGVVEGVALHGLVMGISGV